MEQLRKVRVRCYKMDAVQLAWFMKWFVVFSEKYPERTRIFPLEYNRTTKQGELHNVDVSINDKQYDCFIGYIGGAINTL